MLKDSFYYLDINSSYPYVMSTDLPIGKLDSVPVLWQEITQFSPISNNIKF